MEDIEPINMDTEPINMDESDTSLYLIETPKLSSNKYPANVLCYFVIGKK